ncbi:hypothetical protein KIPB_005197 [Kipferlia bialata]|uniref:Uncharacterized protein n=1 Tax=Kipferlia bialata TaxID=797122 RepID=A0A9K3GIV6_9EUKA|nr:hypothetical protein KIPB_005197 [Kipferlia bialata]|eukprot:g5197.t1
MSIGLPPSSHTPSRSYSCSLSTGASRLARGVGGHMNTSQNRRKFCSPCLSVALSTASWNHSLTSLAVLP